MTLLLPAHPTTICCCEIIAQAKRLLRTQKWHSHDHVWQAQPPPPPSVTSPATECSTHWGTKGLPMPHPSPLHHHQPRYSSTAGQNPIGRSGFHTRRGSRKGEGG